MFEKRYLVTKDKDKNIRQEVIVGVLQGIIILKTIVATGGSEKLKLKILVRTCDFKLKEVDEHLGKLSRVSLMQD